MDRTALILAGHGSQESTEIQAHADTIRRLSRFTQVRVALWKQPPFLRDALEGLEGFRVVVVPVFAAAGYFVRTVLPRELARDVAIAAPVGTHPRLPALIEAEIARQGLDRRGSELLVVGHGNPEDPGSAEATSALAATLGGHPFFLDQAPFLADWRETVQAPSLIVVPFFVGRGRHTEIDVPRQLGADAPIAGILPPFGGNPALVEIILDRADSAL